MFKLAYKNRHRKCVVELVKRYMRRDRWNKRDKPTEKDLVLLCQREYEKSLPVKGPM